MKKILIAAVLLFTTGIISSCSKPDDINTSTKYGKQIINTTEKKDLGSAD